MANCKKLSHFFIAKNNTIRFEAPGIETKILFLFGRPQKRLQWIARPKGRTYSFEI